MKKKIKGKFNFILLIFLAFLVLYFTIKDDFPSILEQLRTIQKGWLFLGICVMIVYFLVRSVPLYVFARKFKKNYSFKSAVSLTLKTEFFNGVTPFASGGQPFQVYELKKQKINLTDGTNIIIQNFIVYQIALMLLGIFAITYNHYFHLFEEVTLLKKLVTLGFFVNLTVTICLFALAFLENFNNFIIKKGILLLTKLHLIKDPLKKEKDFRNYTKNFHEGAVILLQEKKKFIGLIGINILALLLLYLIPLIVLKGTNYQSSLNILSCIVSVSYVMLISSFVPLPGATGGIEYAFMSFFGYFITKPTISTVMILWRFMTYYLGILLGAIALTIKGRER